MLSGTSAKAGVRSAAASVGNSNATAKIAIRAILLTLTVSGKSIEGAMNTHNTATIVAKLTILTVLITLIHSSKNYSRSIRIVSSCRFESRVGCLTGATTVPDNVEPVSARRLDSVLLEAVFDLPA